MVMLLLIGIYASFVGGGFLHAERMDSSMEIVRFLREHLEEGSTELDFRGRLKEK